MTDRSNELTGRIKELGIEFRMMETKTICRVFYS